MTDLDLAHEADCLDETHYGTVWAEKLRRFAALVRADEREQCAALCDSLRLLSGEFLENPAAAIRERGEQ